VTTSSACGARKLARYALAVGVVTGIALTMIGTDRFWIAQALIGALVIAEVTEGAAKLVWYRRGV
jgi:hypothetical protein